MAPAIPKLPVCPFQHSFSLMRCLKTRLMPALALVLLLIAIVLGGGCSSFNHEWKMAAANPVPTITLVGHSTGAVYICHLLKAAAHLAPNLRFDAKKNSPHHPLDKPFHTNARSGVTLRVPSGGYGAPFMARQSKWSLTQIAELLD